VLESLQLCGGLVWLLLAGDLLVRGALALAKRAAVSPLVVGLTVVALGTSAPELVVCLDAALKGHPGIALGNVVGSNIANVLLVLGVPALLAPTHCDHDSLPHHAAEMLAVSAFFVALCFLGPLSWVHGSLLLGLLALGLAREVRKHAYGLAAGAEEEFERVLGLPTQRRMIAFFLVVGIVGLPLGAELAVDGAVGIAQIAGVSDEAIGLTVIALGTSLPELGTTVVAAIQRHSDVAVGNVIGGNLLNILAIMGLTCVLVPVDVGPGFLRFDLWVMLGTALLLTRFAWRRRAIARGAGAVFLVLYAAYVWAVLGGA
jgi:cation:H+ antiporter